MAHRPVSRSDFSDTVLVGIARSGQRLAAEAAGRPAPGTPEYDAYWTPARIAAAAVQDDRPATDAVVTDTRPAAVRAATRPVPNLATPGQRSFVESLLRDRDVTGTMYDGWTPDWTRATKSAASSVIDFLKTLPFKASRSTSTSKPDVPAGRYAVEHEGTLKFYKVDRPTEGRWAGYTFVKVMASDDEHRVSRETEAHVLAVVAADPEAASRRYGREIGACGRCGRTLTSDWRKQGIGPECSKKGF